MHLAATLFLLSAAPMLPAPDPAKEVKTIQVLVDAPAGCADDNGFFSSLSSRTHLVRRATGDESRTTLRVRLLDMGRYVLGDLRVVDNRGETDTRKVQGANCDDVVQALALAAAVALDPSVLLPETDPNPASETIAQADPPLTVAPAVPEPGKARNRTDETSSSVSRTVPRFELGVASMVSLFLSSGISPGIALFGRWTPARGGNFGPTLGMAITYLRNDVLQSPGAVQASLTGLVVTVCGLGWGGSIVTVKPCGLAMAGLLSVSGHQVLHSSSVDLLWLSAGAVGRMAIHLGGGLAFDLQAGVSAPFFSREFYTTLPSHVVERTPTFSPEVGVGLAYSF
ncbi:MAG TPA: hypothetical protein VIV60_03940 [Polyangiaceae bacterium]